MQISKRDIDQIFEGPHINFFFYYFVHTFVGERSNKIYPKKNIIIKYVCIYYIYFFNFCRGIFSIKISCKQIKREKFD